MTTTVAAGTDSRRVMVGWWHYWLTLQLPAEVRERLCLPAQAGCVAAFLAREGMEDTLIRWMQRICSTQRQWLVTLDLINSVPGAPPCWQVRQPAAFQGLQQQLTSLNPYLEGSDCPAIQLGQPIQWRVPAEALGQRTDSIHFMLQGILLFRRACYAAEGKEITVFGLRP